MTKSYLLALIIAVVAVLWIASKAILPSGETDVPEAQAEESNVKDTLMRVQVQTVFPLDYTKKIVSNGRSVASRQVTLRTEAEGQVVSIIADEGRHVQTGDRIVTIDVRERRERVNEARELLRQRKIELDSTRQLSKQGYASDVRLAQTQSAYESAQASLKKAQIELDKTTITAPFDGVLGKRSVDVGDYLKVGDAVTEIVDLDPLEVTVYVNEKEVVQIHPDDEATLIFSGGHKRNGVVSFVAPAADEKTRTFRVDIEFDNAEDTLPAGLTAEVQIAVDDRKAYQISPSVLTLNDDGNVGVKIVNDSNVVKFVPVIIIDDTASLMWVTGLEGNARVVTVGQDFIVDGQTVEPVEGDQ